jgi:ATP-dependent Clp protease adaptor protein ClpS
VGAKHYSEIGGLIMTDRDKREPLDPDGAGSAATAKPRDRESPKKSPPRLLPPWKVMLHNDDANDIDKVIQVVRQLTGLNKEEAQARVDEAHRTGVALLLVTHQERAELYVEQFATYTLTVTAEPDN